MDNQHETSVGADIATACRASNALEALHWVAAAAGTDKTRPNLSGVAFARVGDILQIVATDSYRLHVAWIACAAGVDDAYLAGAPVAGEFTVIPAAAIPRYARKDTLHGVDVGDDLVTLALESGRFTGAKLDSQYPDISQLLRDPEWETDGMFTGVRLAGGNGYKQAQNLPACIVDDGHGGHTLAYAPIGENPIGVNPAFVADVCSQKHLTSENTIKIRTKSPLRPVLFTRTAPGIHLEALVMPIRLV